MKIELSEMQKIIEFYESLGDEESKRLYAIRWKFCNDLNRTDFVRSLIDLYSDWHLVDFSSYYERMRTLNPKKKIVIYGFGKVGKINKSLLEKAGYRIDYIVDRNFENLNQKEKDVVIYSPEKVYKDADNPIVVISISDTLEERCILRTLRELHGVHSENIYFAANGGILLGVHGNQYFDLPYLTKEDEEIFVDGGCYNGETTKYFQDWAGDNLKKAIAFECDKRNLELIRKNMDSLNEVGQFQLVEVGLYSRKAQLHFNEATLPTSSCISGEGVPVFVDSLDNVLNGEKVTFIKLDVQGAELEALKGAERTIKQYRPKLAISIYHKFEDIYEIPLWLMKTVPEYRFYIRHYNADECETILYAL